MDSDQVVNETAPTPVDLAKWWKAKSFEDLQLYAEKAKEYGSFDLRLVGIALEEFAQIDGVGIEMGIAYHILSKIARVFSGYKAGALPSVDTLRDLSVYAMMLRAAREGVIG